MIARIFWTAVLLLVAGIGFFGSGSTQGGPLNPFGIMLLALSGVVWFGWEPIRDAYAYREEVSGANRGRSYLMLVRLGPVLVNRLVRKDGD
ncbi:MAG TPA: hypothetical protein VND87_00335 [Stellaceae bacterium]|nr:hypothetical protein [Stellaceae bacterium]